MLDTLDDIDWGELTHAYGSAEEIPNMLRMLASDNPSQQQAALYGFYSNIYHQGSIYNATVATIPFLLEIAFESDHIARDEVLFFVAHCCRTHMWFSKRESPEAAWSREIIDHVVTRSSDLVDCIGEERDVERGALACLFYCEDRQWVAHSLLDRLDAINPANHNLAALAAHGSDPETLDVLFEIATDRSMRLASLIAKATIGGLSGRQVHLLTEGIADPEIREPIESVLDDIGECLGSLPELLAMATRDVWPLIISPLCDYMEQTVTITSWHALVTLLGMAFQEPLDPVEPSSLGEVQRGVLESAVRASAIWSLGNTGLDIREKTGIVANQADELADFLGYEEPVVALIMTPSESPVVQHRLERIDRLEWKNTPWIIFRGDTSKLDDQISEDDDYFTPDVMSDAKQIAMTIMDNIADEVVPNLGSFRFYPTLSKPQLIAVCEANGWIVHEAPGWAHDLSSISEAEVVADRSAEDHDPGMRWDELTDRQKAEIDQCVVLLDDSGWQEAKNWTAFAKTAGFSVTPLMVARYFGVFDIEVCYWPYDRAVARQTGEHTGTPYLTLTIVDDGTPVSARLYFKNDLPAAVSLLTQYQDALAASSEGFTQFLRASIVNLDEVMLEFDDGILQKLSLDAVD